MDRFDRIYHLHQLLQHRRTPVPLDRMCEELGCHERTVYRAINDLRDHLGAPVDCIRERGYIYDPKGKRPWELPGLWFSAEELQALLILYQHLEQLEPGLLQDQLQPLRDRLERLLADRRLGTSGLAERVRFISIGQRRSTPRHFARVAEALLQRNSLELLYRARSHEQTTERTVDPQRLIHYRDTWYLDAWCRWRQALRTFSLDRIERCKVTNAPARDIDAGHLDAHFASAYGIFAGEPEAVAVLRFSPRGARWAAAVEWHPQQSECWLDAGEYELHVPYSRPEELIRDVLAYGRDVEVVAPMALREAVKQRILDALAVYGERPEAKR